MHSWRHDRKDANDLYAGLDSFEVGSHAADETSASDGAVDDLHSVDLLVNFLAYCSLPCNHDWVIIRRNVDLVILGCRLSSVYLCTVAVSRNFLNGGSVVANLLQLLGVGILGYEHRQRDVEAFGHVRHTSTVVAAGGCRNSFLSLCSIQGENFVAASSGFKRSRDLLALHLQEEVGFGPANDPGVVDVSSELLVSCNDLGLVVDATDLGDGLPFDLHGFSH